MGAIGETTVYTIGHSNHSREGFLNLLEYYHVETLADIRSRPVSRFPHFRQDALRAFLSGADIEYLYLGEELGGQPPEDEYYDSKGHVVYERLTGKSGFRRGILKIVGLAPKTRLALMCTEGDPSQCHRHPMVARALLERDLVVQHICRDGSLVEAASLFGNEIDQQLPFLEPTGEDLSWRSPKRIR